MLYTNFNLAFKVFVSLKLITKLTDLGIRFRMNVVIAISGHQDISMFR